jgi:hypothetical protein
MITLSLALFQITAPYFVRLSDGFFVRPSDGAAIHSLLIRLNSLMTLMRLPTALRVGWTN